ncbi:MAG: hypothetical protein OXG29_01420 [Gammaproteobacteria bacterium]|nr:hypothetical protein [Gammaproteobacteria bacterium]MCY3989349.1 hypothetical protein [Gammaproteobacteria bacterium]
MKFLKAAIIGLAVSLAGTAVADDLPEELQRCAQLQNAEVRLACYDALAAISASRPQHASSATEAPTPAVSPSAAAPSAAVQAPEQESGQSLAQRVFGLLPGRDEGDNLLESRVVGEIRNPGQGTRFTLENGQVWQQTDRTRRNYRATNPRVEIREGFMNSYRMRLEGLNGRIRVRRVK